MIMHSKLVKELKCTNCGTVQLMGQTFNGKRCCSNHASYLIIGEKKVITHKLTNEEEKNIVLNEMRI